MAIELSEVQLLNDDQLFEKLREFQIDIGPIVDSTRSVYQLMLLNKLNENEASHESNGVVQEEGNQKDVVTKTAERSRRSLSRPPAEEPQLSPAPSNPSPHTFKRWNEVDDPFENKLFDDAVTFRSRASLTARNSTKLYDTPSVPSSKKGGSIVKTVLLLAFVFLLAAFIIFVVAQSRDPYNNIETEANTLAGEVNAGLKI